MYYIELERERRHRIDYLIKSNDVESRNEIHDYNTHNSLLHMTYTHVYVVLY